MDDPVRSGRAPTGPCGGTSACSARCSAGCSSSRRARTFLAAEERVRASARRSREVGDPVARPRGGARAPAARRRRRCCARSRSTSSSRTRPSSTTGSAAAASHAERTGRRASRSTRRSSRSRRCPPDELARRLGQVSLELVLTAHPTEATRRTLLRAHVRIAELLAAPRRPRPDAGGARRARGAARRGDHDPLADRRGAPRPAARRRRDPARALVLRGEPVRRRRAAAREYRRRRARRAAAVLVRHLDRRRPRRQSRGRPARRSSRRSSAPASRRSRATATRCARSPIALSSSRSLVDVSPELEESIARDERECTRLPRRPRPDDSTESRTGGSSRSCGGGSGTTATRRPTSCSPTSP